MVYLFIDTMDLIMLKIVMQATNPRFTVHIFK